jgi:hypothetical protein
MSQQQHRTAEQPCCRSKTAQRRAYVGPMVTPITTHHGIYR